MRPLYYSLLTSPGIWPKPKEGTAGAALLRAGFPGSQAQWAGLTCAIRSCGYSLGPGLVAKGAGAPDAVCSRSHGLTPKLVPRRMERPGRVRHLCSGHHSALRQYKGIAPLGGHGLSFAPVQAEQAYPAQRGSQKSTQIELGSGTEAQAPEKQTAQILRHEHRDPRAQMQFCTHTLLRTDLMQTQTCVHVRQRWPPRVGEMAQLIIPLADFQRVPAPSTWQLRHVINSSSRGSDISF